MVLEMSMVFRFSIITIKEIPSQISTHSGYLDSNKILSTIDAPPRGQKIIFFFLQMKLFSFCADIAPKSQLACLVDPGKSFDTPGIAGGASIVEIQEF